jgi:hypothetical protein
MYEQRTVPELHGSLTDDVKGDEMMLRRMEDSRRHRSLGSLVPGLLFLLVTLGPWLVMIWLLWPTATR